MSVGDCMLPPTMREIMEEVGIRNISIKHTEKGLVGTGEFPGTGKQIKRRLAGKLDVDPLESAGEPTIVRCKSFG